MARLPIPSSVPPNSEEAGRRFQLPARNEKRTQASTMFSTTAKNLTSNIPFRWRQGQVDIFEDWIRSRGPNAATADLVPLLRALDLDGYEDVKNKDGECVHDLIITKVRRKISRTKDSVATQRETTREMQATTDGARIKCEKGASEHQVDVLTPMAPALPKFVDDFIERGLPPDKRQPRIIPKDYRSMPPTKYGAGDTLVDHMPPNSWEGVPEIPHGPGPASPADPRWSSSRPKAPGSNTATKGSSNRSESTSDSEFHCAWTPPSRPRRVVDLRTSRGRRNHHLEACIEKLKHAMKELSLEINNLPDDTDAAALETAAYDATLEVEHLDNLIYEYITH
ncbi:hypothetical protein F4824DRAFT_481683 [Ustulina deusta]|nr:hypothetical protein F4824DRAFT_481683 [Ustulina deusta]